MLKPRGVPHAFWNKGPEPTRFIEIISPLGFEKYFEELAELVYGSAGGEDPNCQIRPDLPHGARAGTARKARPDV